MISALSFANNRRAQNSPVRFGQIYYVNDLVNTKANRLDRDKWKPVLEGNKAFMDGMGLLASQKGLDVLVATSNTNQLCAQLIKDRTPLAKDHPNNTTVGSVDDVIQWMNKHLKA